MFGVNEVEALAKLLTESSEEKDNDTQKSIETKVISYHPFAKPPKPIPESEKNFKTVITSTRQICTTNEEKQNKFSKKEPKYCITYQQSLGAKDVAFIDPFSSYQSDSILIKIILPKEDVSSIDVKVKDDNITLVLKSNKYYLSTTLPQKVIGNNYKAKWLNDIHTLQIQIKLKK